MLKLVAIELGELEWAPPIVLSWKTRLPSVWVQYDSLNRVPILDSYPTPRLNEILDSLGDERISSELDISCSYGKIKTDGANRDKQSSACIMGRLHFQESDLDCTRILPHFRK